MRVFEFGFVCVCVCVCVCLSLGVHVFVLAFVFVCMCLEVYEVHMELPFSAHFTNVKGSLMEKCIRLTRLDMSVPEVHVFHI